MAQNTTTTNVTVNTTNTKEEIVMKNMKEMTKADYRAALEAAGITMTDSAFRKIKKAELITMFEQNLEPAVEDTVVATEEEMAADFKADMIAAEIDAYAAIVAENAAKEIYGDAYERYYLASVEENENEIEFSFEPSDDLVAIDGYCYEDCEWCVEIRVRKEDLNVKFRNIYLWLDDYGYVDETEASEWLTWEPKEKEVVSVGDLPITKDNAPNIEEPVEKGGDDMKVRNRRLLLNLLCYRWVAESRLFYKSNKYKEKGGDFYFIASRKRQLGVTCKCLKDLGWQANPATLDRVAEILREEGLVVSETRDVYIPTAIWKKFVSGKQFLDKKKGNKDIVTYLKEVI